ncbi:MAG: adenosylmethionine decarboxylase [Alphaproteobacteria bacterium]|nr:adenosylmethionine decarboxylase [Alphaproteobacteria bacterium]
MLRQNALFQLGMDLDPRSSTAQEESPSSTHASAEPEACKDFFVERDGKTYAGSHVIVDIWDAKRVDDLDHVRSTLEACVAAAGATLLHIHLHHFTPNGGISGVAVLAESHISIHSWPERGYAALDIFMCGEAEPARAVPVLESAFGPCRAVVTTHLRGIVA